jgi:hypothetical protein
VHNFAVLRILLKEAKHLLLRYSANFHALGAGMFAALDSNSGLCGFQKIRQEFDQRFVRAVLDGRRTKPDLQGDRTSQRSAFPRELS